MLLRMLFRKDRYVLYPLITLWLILLLSGLVGMVIFHTISVMRTLPASHSALYAKHVQLAKNNRAHERRASKPIFTEGRKEPRKARDVARNRKYDPDSKKEKKILSSSTKINRRTITKTHNASTIAYAISLIKCGDFQTRSTGLIDAALVLRHSIHLIHRNSKYGYQMVVIVHPQAIECSHLFEKVGFLSIVVEPPVTPDQIKGEYLSKHIHKEWCCGHDEFIKWHPYRMAEYPVVVHVDIDFAFVQPLDDLYDAIQFDKDSPEGRAARSRLLLERRDDAKLPSHIEAFYTRDWPQVIPGRIPGYQAGFLVVKPNVTVWDELSDIVKEGHFVEGFSRNNGWGGLGYGGYVGAMAMQGLLAYYYDHIRPGAGVELSQCRYNWMGMDLRYNHPPSFQPRHPKKGQCRNDRGDDCEDCRLTPLSQITSIHYTQCRKPWNCISIGADGGNKGSAIDTWSGNLTKCLEVVTFWHSLRTDLEQSLYKLTQDSELVHKKGSYREEIFQGHCIGEGGENYSPISSVADTTLAQIPKLYQREIA
mmetsp:Transcript_18262/g.27666  ORF Transcript_18262/g.27666 Transcript_18262/m.27666 type:complete len:535 (-) Transcript_18262:217-1821(-)